jgi:hypothetical protein
VRALEREGTGGRALAAAAGLLAGAAFLCRQNAGIVAPVLIAVALLKGRRATAGWIAGGFVVLPLLVLATYAAAGALDVFLFCFWGYNRSIYVAATHLGWDRWLAAPGTAAGHYLRPVPTLAVVGGLGLAASLARPGRPRAAVAAVGLALTASTFLGFRFFPHYFVLAIPFWAACGGDLLSRWPRRPAARAAIALLVLAGLVLEVEDRGPLRAARRLQRALSGSSPVRLAHADTWPGRDRLAASVASRLRRAARPGDRVFVWGMRPHDAVYSRLVPATRFVIGTFLTGLVPWERVAPHEDTTPWIVPGSWDLLMEDLRRERPRFVVDESRDPHFGGGAYAPEEYPPLARFLAEEYELAFTVGDGDRVRVWVREGHQRMSRSSSITSVWASPTTATAATAGSPGSPPQRRRTATTTRGSRNRPMRPVSPIL